MVIDGTAGNKLGMLLLTVRKPLLSMVMRFVPPVAKFRAPEPLEKIPVPGSPEKLNGGVPALPGASVIPLCGA